LQDFHSVLARQRSRTAVSASGTDLGAPGQSAYWSSWRAVHLGIVENLIESECRADGNAGAIQSGVAALRSFGEQGLRENDSGGEQRTVNDLSLSCHGAVIKSNHDAKGGMSAVLPDAIFQNLPKSRDGKAFAGCGFSVDPSLMEATRYQYAAEASRSL
jgi:hypothetical protein